MRRALTFLFALFALLAGVADATPLKGLGRFQGLRENALIGYGIVVGLSGSGDSPRNAVTRQALSNVYSRLGAVVDEEAISSRNVAVVVVIASLPASANVGDRISVTASSTGDARSLAGGTLLMTPLRGPDGRTYALAQGPLVTGGDSFESLLNQRQRNYPTTARIEGGATVETAVSANLLNSDGTLSFVLFEPSFTTAVRAAEAINAASGRPLATAIGADEVRVNFADAPNALPQFIASLENLEVTPDQFARIVINERTGTVVAGGDVMISSIVVSQGDIRVTVTAETSASQPGYVYGYAGQARSLVITNTSLDVDESDDVVARFPNTSVADLVEGLSQAHVSTRRIISILQAIKAQGALHAEIVVQ